MNKEDFFKRFYKISKKLRIDFDRNMDYLIADLYSKKNGLKKKHDR